MIKQEVGGESSKKIVLVDTRSALDFESFHISGSVHLNSQDFIILKNPKTNLRILDPDVAQTIERMAKRGLSPLKSVILISHKKDSVENKKWNWLLHKLDINDVSFMSIEEFRVLNHGLRPQPEAGRMPVWEPHNGFQAIEKSHECFINWSEESCATK